MGLAGGRENDSTHQVGPARGGFKRSPALRSQIHQLNAIPEADYVLPDAITGRIRPVTTSEESRANFRQIRNLAFYTGDSDAVVVLGVLILLAKAGDNLVKPEAERAILDQLKREFGGGTENRIHALVRQGRQ
jgi:hypothetical protein